MIPWMRDRCVPPGRESRGVKNRSSRGRGVHTVLVLIALLLVFVATPASGSEDDGFQKYLEPAKAGDPVAQFFLGLGYQQGGYDIQQEPALAVRWYQKAVDQGDADAQLCLGMLYLNGVGVATDSAKAEELISESAKQGHPLAMAVWSRFIRERGKVQLACALLDLAQNRLKAYDMGTSVKFRNLRNKFAQSLSLEEIRQGVFVAAQLRQRYPLYVPKLFTAAFPPGPMAFTKEEAEEYLKEVVPMVERAARRKFKQVPEMVLGSRSEVAQSLKLDLLPQLKNLAPNASEAEQEEAAEVQSLQSAPFLLGKYGMMDKKLYILPRNVIPIMKRSGVPDKMILALVKVIIAHELTHALQDQHTGIQKKIMTITDPDALMALNAAMEGHAVFIQDSVGTDLKCDREIIEFGRFFSAGMIDEKNTAKSMTDKVKAARFEQIYLGGRRFIDYIHQTYNREYIWEVLENPPTRSSMIAVPESYTAAGSKKLNLTAILHGIERMFTSDSLQTQNVDLGIMKLMAAYANMDEADRARIVPQIEQVQVLVMQRSKSPGVNSATLYVLRDSAAVPDFMGALEKMARTNLKRLSGQGGIEIKDIQIGSIPGIQADVTQRISFTVAVTGKDISSTERLYRIGKGRLVVELSDADLGMTPRHLSEVSTEIFSRFDRAFGGGKKPSASKPPARPGQRAAPPRKDEGTLLKEAIGHFKKSNFQRSRDCLRPVLQKNPKHVQGRFLLAVMAAKERQYQKAWAHIRIAYQEDPKNQRIRDFITRLRQVAPLKSP